MCRGIGVRALSDLGRRWLSCPKNLHNSRTHDCRNRDTNALKLHEFEKQTRKQLTLWREILHGSLISRILDFSVFAGKNENLDIGLSYMEESVLLELKYR